jgi:hypothetical protein
MIKRSVFGSKAERELFTSLQSRWAARFDLWPSLPLAQIIDIESARRYLRDKELDFFLKTNIDYTLCTKSGLPILSIEFDGLGKGHSRQGEYVQQEPTRDPHRKLKLDLKLKVAQKEKYPFFVVSFEESKPLHEDVGLTIVDGIIGQILARQELQESLRTMYDEHKDYIESLHPSLQHEYVQDLVWDAEIQAELRWDPIVKQAAKYEYEAFERGIVKSYKTEYLNDPQLPDGDPFTDFSIMEKRIAVMKNAIRVGCRIIADTPKVAIVETVWLRNFEDNAVSPLHIAVNIAELLAFRRALDLVEN